MSNLKLNNFSGKLYTAADCQKIDQQAIATQNVSGYQLMMRAGEFVFDCISPKLFNDNIDQPRVLSILCGSGNNAGDGYVVGALAIKAKCSVTVFALDLPQTPDAIKARQLAQSAGCEIIDCRHEPDLSACLKESHIVVDAMLGTGVNRCVSGYLKEVIHWVNQSLATVISCDIPTGLNSDTGCIMGCAINANITATLIVLKKGLFTADGKEYSGEVLFNDLNVPHAAYAGIEHTANLIQVHDLKTIIQPRSESAHKGVTGLLAAIGGSKGMMGAILMAGKAAFKMGCRRVRVITASDHASMVSLYCPELLTQAVADHTESNKADQLHLAEQIYDALTIGPGLGQTDWSMNVYQQVMESTLPMVVDADGLNILAKNYDNRDNWILTPHPGEAARLLNCSAKDVQANRFEAATKISQKYGGVCVLKGSGTLISSQNKLICVSPSGNSGQAVAGMGDVLTGFIAGLLVQGYSNFDAACLAVWIHGHAADCLAKQNGKVGMMATDLFDFAQRTHNELMI